MKTRITLLQNLSSIICWDTNKKRTSFIYSFAMLTMLLSSFSNLQAQVVVNEILPDGTVELKNLGTETVDVSSYWLCHFPDYQQISNSNIISGDAMLAPGAIMAIDNFNFLNAADGELGLYTTNTFGSSTAIIDYVEWGSTGHQRSSVAVAAGIWTTGDFAAAFSAGESIEYDGEGDSSSDWAATATPSIGDENSNADDNCEAFGGTLEGGPFAFCVDGESDFVSGITLTGNEGTTSQWVITDEQGTILGLPPMPGVVDFDGAGAGTCLIWNVTYDEISGLEMDLNIEDLEGCFEFSNSIAVVRTEVSGGTLEGGPFAFCVDGESDFVSGITLTGNEGTTSQWVITDEQGNILGLPPMPGVVDFDGAGAGTCLIWSVTYEDITGLEMDGNLENLEGCYELSNSIAVVRTAVSGGALEGGPFEFCVDGEADFVSGITLTGNEGTNSQWVITDEDGLILGLPPMPGVVDFDGAGAGVCLIWNVSYEDGLEGLAADENINTLEGCHSISNSITVTRSVDGPACNTGSCDAEGGTLEGGPFEFTVGDGEADMIPAGSITVANSNGENFQWIVTDDSGYILGLPPMPGVVNFDGAGPGTCEIWYLRYDGEIAGLAAGLNIADLEGECFDLSDNVVQVIRNNLDGCEANGGELFGGPFEFTVGDGEADMIPTGSITVANSNGENVQWIVTDDSGYILGLPPMPGVVNFDGAGAGTCEIWYLRYEGEVEGLGAGLNIADIEGECFDLSNNAVQVIRTVEGDCQANGGELFGGPFEFCAEDGEADMIEPGSIVHANSQGTNSQWVITDEQGNILGLPPMPGVVNFEEAGPGVCLIWNVSFEDGLEGLAADGNINELEGCYSISSSITVTRTVDGPACQTGGCEAEGGTLEGGPFTFCVGDGEEDFVSGITLAGNSGTTNQWVVTDHNGNVLGLPPTPEAVNFDEAPAGLCLIWNLTYDGSITGLAMDENIFNLEGCYDFSNHVRVNRVNDGPACQAACGNEGGILEGGPFTFCVGDGEEDFVSGITVTGNIGETNQWVVTDQNGNILGLPPTPDVVNFDEAPAGLCLIWNITYDGNVTGLAMGENIFNVEGCHDFSNHVRVNRVNNGPACQAVCGNEGGTLEGGPFTFCVGDGEEDFVSEITVTGNIGETNQWVVTDHNGNILGLPPTPEAVNFDEAPAGLCLIWNMTYDGNISGLAMGENIFNVEGCHDFSNHVRVYREDEGPVCAAGKAEVVLESVRVFPNPASNYLTVSMEANGSQGAVTLVNTVGQVMSRQLVTESTDEVYFSLEEAPAGIYFININIGEQSTTKKVVVTKGGSLGF